MKMRKTVTVVIGTGLLLFLFTIIAAQAQLVLAQSGTKVFLPHIVYQPSSALPANPPPSTTSYYFYMAAYTPSKARSLGCQLGTRDKNMPGRQDSLVILDFGITQFKDGVYGASGMQRNGFYTMDQIAKAVQEYGVGYWQCTATDFESHLTIGIGTNNYNNSAVYNNLSLTYEHGRAWAQMVNGVNNWFLTSCTNGCNGQVNAAGANDIELAWSSPAAAQNWVNGYDSINETVLYNFGAAEGCPNACGGGGYSWTLEQVWSVTNAGPIYSVPEIYLNDGRNAKQWYELSKYSAARHGYPYNFAGVMTTWGACQQEDDDACPYIDNTPIEGWTQLHNLINAVNSPSTWDEITYLTDIMWLR